MDSLRAFASNSGDLVLTKGAVFAYVASLARQKGFGRAGELASLVLLNQGLLGLASKISNHQTSFLSSSREILILSTATLFSLAKEGRKSKTFMGLAALTSLISLLSICKKKEGGLDKLWDIAKVVVLAGSTAAGFAVGAARAKKMLARS